MSNPVWFITGASSGFGRAFAEHAIQQGYRVAVAAPESEPCDPMDTNLVGDGYPHMPETVAYSETAGATRRAARGMNQTQPGDPRKAARAIELALASPNTPLRLQLGEDAVTMVRAHAETLLADMGVWERVAVATKLDE